MCMAIQSSIQSIDLSIYYIYTLYIHAFASTSPTPLFPILKLLAAKRQIHDIHGTVLHSLYNFNFLPYMIEFPSESIT